MRTHVGLNTPLVTAFVLGTEPSHLFLAFEQQVSTSVVNRLTVSRPSDRPST